MKIKMLSILTVLLGTLNIGIAHGADAADAATHREISIDEILARNTNNTECATGAFAAALYQNSDAVSDDMYEETVQQWAHQVFAQADVLQQVLACPEIANASEMETIHFAPIVYVFPSGREITINYATQPKLLRQRLSLTEKRGLPIDEVNPAVGEGDNIWTSTDPAWYGIMVTEAGALSDFVGPDKNNTISLQYIYDNIDDLYPKGSMCTSKSALANNNEAINKAVTATVGLKEATGKKDSNDYYVAGDINLQWIAYAEIGLDVILTVVTFGGGAVISGVTKAARASKTLKNMSKELRALTKLDKVRDYMRLQSKYEHAAKELKDINRLAHPIEHAKKAKELETIRDSMRTMEEIEDVKRYKKVSDSYSEINAWRHNVQALKRYRVTRTGNVLTRGWRALKAANSGGKALNRGAKVARAGMKSGKVRDWLFHSTMRNAARVARLEETGGLLYGVWKFGLDMYDYTETSTDEYTSGIDMKPFLLLSADDLEGQENEINYGMWLLWMGDTINAEDDDAAYLQAMDFADKFHQDLMEVQDNTSSPCNVDIYVVRPIIRNPGDDDQQLFYLIMNDTPWTTAE